MTIAMTPALHHWLGRALESASHSLPFMAWNTFLALIPLGLSLWLFGSRSSRHLIWWAALATFVAFLPNAPYVLTDIIHLIRQIRQGAAIWIITFVLLPQYFLFMLIGTEAYVLSLINLRRYLAKQGYRRWTTVAELSLHALCALGIYLGRFPRFNSWDVLTRPHGLLTYMLNEFTQPKPLAIVLLTFAGISVLYGLLKPLTLAVIWYWRSEHHQFEHYPLEHYPLEHHRPGDRERL